MRRAGLLLILLLLAGAAGYAGYWFYVANRLQSTILPWAEARRAEGSIVGWETISISGFPTRFRLTFTRAVYGRKAPVPYTTSAGVILAEARPWNRRRWQVSAPQGATLQSPLEVGSVAAATLDGTVLVGAMPGTIIDLAAHDLAGGGEFGRVHIADAEAHLVLPDASPASHRDTAFDLTLRLTRLTLPVKGTPFGDTVEAFSVTGSVKGALPGGPLRQALAAWRDDGGTVEVQEGVLRWGSLAVDANGTLALDAALQPIGAFTAVILDHNALIDAIVAAGEMREADASLVKTFLGLMAKTGPDGRKQLTLPVRLQNDRVFLGPAQIAELPRFTW